VPAADVSIPSRIDCGAVNTGPSPLQVDFEQTIDGYIRDGVVSINKSALCGNETAEQALRR
jgi:hypothetical protein